jgi:Spy/CpxP family protein refolding chaperone
MNSALKWKLVAGFLLVFVAGGVTGAFVAAATTRHFFFTAPHHGLAAERMRARLQAELNLTPEQMKKISPIIDRTGAQLEQIRMETTRRVHETFADSHRQISEDLTPEQKAKFEQMRQRRQRWMHRMHRREAPELESPAPP